MTNAQAGSNIRHVSINRHATTGFNLFYISSENMHDWLKFKKYSHIGEPLTEKDLAWVVRYVTDPQNISTHKFVPLLHKVITQRKYRPESPASKNGSGKRNRTVKDPKKRHIFYASHLDSIIYSYYNSILATAYEKYLSDKGYKNVAVPYRKIPKDDTCSGNKCNIEFAYDAFRFILDNKSRELSVIVADVTSFFDNLDHKLLHQQWKKVLGVSDLPADHYKIFRNLVNYTYVDVIDLFERFKDRIIVERFKPNDTSCKELKRKRISKIKNMRYENAVAFCDKTEFFRTATDLIKADKPYASTVREKLGKDARKGIPQGTPISATLANIYMIDFDDAIYKEVSSRRAYYQRYSDDLIIICDRADEKYFYDLIIRDIDAITRLEIQAGKTHIYRYDENCNGNLVGGIVMEDGNVSPNKQLEYLGFAFDGTKVRVKTSGFSKFYRNMKRAFKRGAFFAKKPHIPSDKLFEGRLYKRFTHLGAKRRLKWKQDSSNPSGFKRTTKYDWGNFISYLRKADNVMADINHDKSISAQGRKIWPKFHRLKKQAYEDIDKHKKG